MEEGCGVFVDSVGEGNFWVVFGIRYLIVEDDGGVIG